MTSKQDLLEISRVDLMSDEQSFVILMQKNQERIYRLAFYLLNDKEEAKDAVQETFIKAWKKIGNLQWDTSQAWLLKMTVNLCLDWLRKRKFSKDLANEKSQDDLELELPDPNPDPLEQCVNQEMQIKIHEAISKLHPSYRTVVILRDMEGLSYQEISEMLGTPVSKVKSDLFRGRRKLREIIRPVFLDYTRD